MNSGQLLRNTTGNNPLFRLDQDETVTPPVVLDRPSRPRQGDAFVSEVVMLAPDLWRLIVGYVSYGEAIR